MLNRIQQRLAASVLFSGLCTIMSHEQTNNYDIIIVPTSKKLGFYCILEYLVTDTWGIVPGHDTRTHKDAAEPARGMLRSASLSFPCWRRRSLTDSSKTEGGS